MGPNEVFKNKTILEIGSGTGLAGLVAANYAEKVVFTDYQDVVMKLINMNINLEAKKAQMHYAMLDWLKIREENYYEDIILRDKNGQNSGFFKNVEFDIVIGSDLMWQSAMIEGLMNTLNLLFEKNPRLIFYHCYIERSLELHYNLLLAYQSNGFIVEYVGENITNEFKEKTF